MTRTELERIVHICGRNRNSFNIIMEAIDKYLLYASTAKPNVELPRGVKLCDCPECGAEIQYGLAQDVIDKFNKVFGTKGAKPNVSGELEEFMNDVEHMQKLYANSKYGLAEEWRDKLAERLDDIMRLGSTDH